MSPSASDIRVARENSPPFPSPSEKSPSSAEKSLDVVNEKRFEAAERAGIEVDAAAANAVSMVRGAGVMVLASGGEGVSPRDEAGTEEGSFSELAEVRVRLFWGEGSRDLGVCASR